MHASLIEEFIWLRLNPNSADISRHDIVSLVCVGLAIARTDRKGNSSADEFIASGLKLRWVKYEREWWSGPHS